jgi:transposase
VLAAERLHGDDTTVPILAKHTRPSRGASVMERGQRRAAAERPSRDRRHEHPARHLHGFTAGIL